MPHTGGYAKKIGVHAIGVLSGQCTLPISLLFLGPRRSGDAKLAKSLSYLFDQHKGFDQDLSLQISKYDTVGVACFGPKQDISSVSQTLLDTIPTYLGKQLFVTKGQWYGDVLVPQTFQPARPSEGAYFTCCAPFK